MSQEGAYLTERDGILGDAVSDCLAAEGVAAMPMHSILVFTYLDAEGEMAVGWFADSSSTVTDSLGLLHHALIGVEVATARSYQDWQTDEGSEPAD